MKRNTAVAAILLLLTTQATFAQTKPVPAQWRPIEQALGTSGKMLPHNVFELDLARKDVQAQIGPVNISPSLDETDFRFMRSGKTNMVAGEIALLGNEIAPVAYRLRQRGFTVSAIHNHLIQMTPQIFYIHFTGKGSATQLGNNIKYALAASKTPLNQGKPNTTPGPLNTREINRIFGETGDWSDGVFTISIDRKDRIRDMGVTVPPEMGVASELAFQPTGNNTAAVTGELTLVASEVEPVINALQGSGITVTALHNHFLTEQPRLFYLHFWARGDATKIASQLKSALSRTNSR